METANTTMLTPTDPAGQSWNWSTGERTFWTEEPLSGVLYIFGLIVLLNVAHNISSPIVRLLTYTRKNSLDDYQKRHPGLVENGRVACHSCGGRSIFFRNEGKALIYRLNSHVCRTCGTELYRSRTRPL